MFTLQKYIKGEQLAAEFLHQDGLRGRIDINTMTGNTLAYALTGVQSLMGLQMGWSNLDTTLISKFVRILAIPNDLIKFCRLEGAMLKKLVEADPRSTPGFTWELETGSVYRFDSTSFGSR